ncbi:hypothetical protein EKO23_03275 [Nocardioides guangzhouensis]|uniref:SGNH hydrolase-type esterase domain-containing protein n=1 Tax=Nocardioides guangzhouensis TaxID=2497878 RepID=A0A4Q4ZLN4_9ACTN|nr:GDSL-type esterase/lipase family protein [Nocardioides guangzhouensis]RYP88364.1 hypothetical protein EKO23_03275 [Nocardioides guangzhouensis]
MARPRPTSSTPRRRTCRSAAPTPRSSTAHGEHRPGHGRRRRQRRGHRRRGDGLLEEIHRRSPEARVLVVDYLAAVPEHACYPLVPVTEEDMVYLHATFLKLNAMVERAAAAGGVELVDTFTPTLGHDVCRDPTVRYAEVYGPSVNGPALGVPAHPNSAGAAAQFRAVLAHLDGG